MAWKLTEHEMNERCARGARPKELLKEQLKTNISNTSPEMTESLPNECA